MKLAILQWVDSNDNRGMGTIERVSTTACDCVKYFWRQKKALGITSFIAGENGQLDIENPKFRGKYDWYAEDDDDLQDRIQEYLNSDSLGTIYIRGQYKSLDPEDEPEYKWWKIQFRNLH